MVANIVPTHTSRHYQQTGRRVTDSFIPSRFDISEPGSSVSILSGYRLDDRAIEVRSPAAAKGFFLYPRCPDRLWGPPSLLSNGYRGSLPRGQSAAGT
jgi:hypothetical protein